MITAKVNATIINDNTGIKSQIPILLTDQGELSPLTDYLLYLESNGRSVTTLERVIRVVAKLLEYMDVNSDVFNDPKLLFQTFSKRLYEGTVGENGIDPSGLYWIPASTIETHLLVSALTGFTDWLEANYCSVNINPLRISNSHEERLNYAAWYRKNQNNFLGHIKDKSINSTTKQARTERKQHNSGSFFQI